MAIFGLLALLALSMYPRRGSGFISFKGTQQAQSWMRAQQAMQVQQAQQAMRAYQAQQAMRAQQEQMKNQELAKKEAMIQNLYDTGRLQQRKFGFSKHASRV